MKKKIDELPPDLKELVAKRVEPHIIGEDAIKIFENVLPTDKLVIDQISQGKDYGIDSFIQLFKMKNPTGEVFFAQVKGQETVKRLKDGDISFKFDLSTAIYLVDLLDVPAVLIICDVKNREVYWLDIQTDETTLQRYDKAKSKYIKKKIKPKNPSLTLKIPNQNKLPETTDKMLVKIEESKEKLTYSNFLKDVKNSSIDDVITKVMDVHREGLTIDGIEYRISSEDQRPMENVILTIHKDGRYIDFVPGENFSSEDTLQMKAQFKFIDDEKGKKKLENFKKLLSGTYHKPVKFTSEEFKVVDSSMGKNKVRLFEMDKDFELTVSPSKPMKLKRTLLIKNMGNGEEIIVHVKTWVENAVVYMESDKDIMQGVDIRLESSMQNGVGTFDFELRTSGIHTLEQEYELRKFLTNLDGRVEFYLDLNGMKKLIFSTDVDPKVIKNKRYFKIIEKLYLIQKEINIQIPYPIPEKISEEDYLNILKLYNLLFEEGFKVDTNTTLVLANKFEEGFNDGGWIEINKDAEFEIFGKKFLLQEYKYNVKGKVKNTERKLVKDKMTYNMKLVNAHHRIIKIENYES